MISPEFIELLSVIDDELLIKLGFRLRKLGDKPSAWAMIQTEITLRETGERESDPWVAQYARLRKKDMDASKGCWS